MPRDVALKDGDVNTTPFVPEVLPVPERDDDSDDAPTSEDDPDSEPEEGSADLPEPPEGFAAVGEKIAYDFGEYGVFCGAVTECTAFHVDWDDGLCQIARADGDREQMSLDECTSAWKHAHKLDPARDKPTKRKPKKKRRRKKKAKKTPKKKVPKKPPPVPPRAMCKAGDTYTFKIDADSCKGLNQIASELGWDTSSMKMGGRSKKKRITRGDVFIDKHSRQVARFMASSKLHKNFGGVLGTIIVRPF
jgi:hypothetical protein